MPTTPNGAPYPPGTGVPPNVPLWMQQLAEWCDTKITAAGDTIATHTTQIMDLTLSISAYLLDVPTAHTWGPSAGWVSASPGIVQRTGRKRAAFDGGRYTRPVTLAVSGGVETPGVLFGALPAALRPVDDVRVPALMGLSGTLIACHVTLKPTGVLTWMPYASGNLLGTASAEQNHVTIPPFSWRTAS